jgi:hypothetical protein
LAADGACGSRSDRYQAANCRPAASSTRGQCPLKERVVSRKYDPLVWLGSKIGRRPRHDTLAVPGRKQ